MEEYEYSFNVLDIKPYLNYCKQNGYILKSIKKQNRKVYECIDNRSKIARITTTWDDLGNAETVLDFKNVTKSKDDLNVSNESKTLKVTDENRDAILSILETLNFKQSADNTRTRYVYVSNDIKFEIDDYLSPNKPVVALEGKKSIVDKAYLEICKLFNN